MVRPAETDVAGSGTHLENGATTIQTSFRSDRLRAIVAALAHNFNIWEIRADIVAVRDFDRCANTDVNAGREIDCDIACRSFKLRIVALAIGADQLCHDSASAGFRTH